tara:strand:- start:250 stop:483 length:234 start_codon:yes stop_codon:yes gene_type:complete
MSTPIFKDRDGTEGKRFVKPTEGRKPRHPELGRNIAKEGEWIIDTPRLRKFLRDEDVFEVKTENKAKSDTNVKKGAK